MFLFLKAKLIGELDFKSDDKISSMIGVTINRHAFTLDYPPGLGTDDLIKVKFYGFSVELSLK